MSTVLKAADDDAVYNRIEFWLDKSNFQLVKGKYFSDSDRLLKVSYIRTYKDQLGAIRPVQTIIVDAIDPKLVTTMTFSDYRLRDIPDSWFQRESLPLLQIR